MGCKATLIGCPQAPPKKNSQKKNIRWTRSTLISTTQTQADWRKSLRRAIPHPATPQPSCQICGLVIEPTALQAGGPLIWSLPVRTTFTSLVLTTRGVGPWMFPWYPHRPGRRSAMKFDQLKASATAANSEQPHRWLSCCKPFFSCSAARSRNWANGRVG